MISYKIHLIRTGKTSTDPVKRYVGQSDVPLCPEGRAAMQELAETASYPPVQMVYTSPLARCVETADILFPELYTVPMDGLMDMNLGAYQGCSFDELKNDSGFLAWLEDSYQNAPPDGEDTLSFTTRIIGAIQSIFDDMMEEKLTNVAVVTHGGVIMTLLAAIGLPRAPLHHWAVDNGVGYTLLLTPQMWMRDHCLEVYAPVPGFPEEESGDSAEWDKEWDEWDDKNWDDAEDSL